LDSWLSVVDIVAHGEVGLRVKFELPEEAEDALPNY
jgi:hypothetical protein